MSVKINNAYNGFWSSNAHNISLRYNEKVWTIIDEIDSQHETYCALQDVKGGSSFALRIEYSSHIRNMQPKEIEAALLETLESTDPEISMVGRKQLVIANYEFHAIDYSLDNKLYGPQTARHAYILTDDYALLLLMAWPQKINPTNGSPFPAKYLSFIDGLNLKNYAPLNSSHL